MTFLKQIPLVIALLAFMTPAFAPAFAMDAPKVSKDAAAQPSGVYKLDSRHASVTWKVMHMGVSNYTARFDKIEGELNFNSKDVTKSSVSVTIDPASVSTGLADFNEEIAGEKFLNNKLITFKSTKVEKTGSDTGKITGDLTINGITKPAVLDTKFYGAIQHPMAKGADLGFSATTTIKRSDFGVSYGVPMVGDEMQIAIETEFLQAATNP